VKSKARLGISTKNCPTPDTLEFPFKSITISSIFGEDGGGSPIER
jgi:hypothetical protein